MNKEASCNTHQYLTFKLGEEVFALGIAKVREVLDRMDMTKIPQTPDFMRGVINVRGGVIPVVDMRLKFGMNFAEETVNTCIIIVELNIDGNLVNIGALADSVEEVIEIDPDNIEPPPSIGTNMRAEFIEGMGKFDDKFIIILNIDRIFSLEEKIAVQGVKEMAD